jgi:hypothetical protein
MLFQMVSDSSCNTIIESYLEQGDEFNSLTRIIYYQHKQVLFYSACHCKHIAPLHFALSELGDV